MAWELAWRFNGRSRALLSANFYGAGPQQPERSASCRNNRRFDPAFRRPAVDDQRNAAAEALEHMLRPGRADRPARVRGWGGERAARSSKKRLHCRMGRDTQSHGGEARRHQ